MTCGEVPEPHLPPTARYNAAYAVAASVRPCASWSWASSCVRSASSTWRKSVTPAVHRRGDGFSPGAGRGAHAARGPGPAGAGADRRGDGVRGVVPGGGRKVRLGNLSTSHRGAGGRG